LNYSPFYNIENQLIFSFYKLIIYLFDFNLF